MRAWLTSLLTGSLLLPSLPAEEFLGADAVLKRLAEASNTKPAPEKKKSSVEELREKIQAFSKDATRMPPDQAAAQWLALYDVYAAIPTQKLYESTSYEGPPRFLTLVGALPPSSAWPLVAKGIEQRKSADNPLVQPALRLFAGLLQPDDGQALKTAVAAFKEDLKKNAAGGERALAMNSYFEQYCQRLDLISGTPAERGAAFERVLAGNESPPQHHPGFQQGPQQLQIPNLVKMVGEEKATSLLERALRLENEISIEGTATRRLAARIALRNAVQLKKPVWELIESEEDVPLYEALVAKFREDQDSNRGRREHADMVFLMHLISVGDTQEAAVLALKIMGANRAGASLFGSYLSLTHRSGHGLGRQELAFLREMLTLDPSLPLWGDLIALAAQINTSEEALAFLQSSLAQPDVSHAALAEMKAHLYRAYFAADRIDDGVRTLRELIRARADAEQPDPAKAVETLQQSWAKFNQQPPVELLRQVKENASRDNYTFSSGQMRLALELVSVGRLLKRPELSTEGLASARTIYEKAPIAEGQKTGLLSPLTEALVKQGRGPEAESLVVEQLAVMAKPQANPREYSGRSNLGDLHPELVWIYHESGRSQDLVKLLEQSPYWASSDLAWIPENNMHGSSLLIEAASALAKGGRKEEARKIARRALQNHPGNDRVYELLMSLGTDGLGALLDETYHMDRFEERPLIWKAKLQFDAGKLDEAEKTVRAAIAVDPSDGEEGKGDRMRAYAVLGDILEKKSDAGQAKIMRGAVAAIRLSENADDWWQAGMLTRAVKMYEEALTLFADAYCIQSRLALRYTELGDFTRAEEHYRRAYELMPESFGRVESHCFGCEGAFSGERAQGIAEKVFTALAEKMPDRPQIFYLLGYLRSQEGRNIEAVTQYRKAVTLDPDYLNAWIKLSALADEADATPDERDTIMLALLRIDPTGKRSSPRLQDTHRLGKLWDALLDSERTSPKLDQSPLFTLAAAKARAESIPSNGGGMERMNWQAQSRVRNADLRRHLVEQESVNVIGSLVDTILREQ